MTDVIIAFLTISISEMVICLGIATYYRCKRGESEK